MDNSKIAMTTEQKWKLPFLLIVIGQSISLIGSSAVQFALIWWITSETNSALLLGLSGMVAYVPVVLFSPAAGVIADRYNRKVICICADLFVGLSAAVFAFLLWLYEMPIWISLLVLLMRAIGNTEILRQYFINHPQSIDKYTFLQNSAFTHWVKEKCSKMC